MALLNEMKKNGQKSQTIIDYICVSDTSMVNAFHQVHIPHISNHDVIFASFEYVIPKHTYDRLLLFVSSRPKNLTPRG